MVYMYLKDERSSQQSIPGFREYLRDCRGHLSLLLIYMVILISVFFAYRLPLEAVLYGLILCVAGSVPVVCWRYGAFRKKVERLKKMKQALIQAPDYFFLEEFKSPAAALEKEYQSFVRLLGQDRERIRNQAKAARDEMTDYYTMWTHQVKTPISAMRLLLQSREAEPDREFLEQLFKVEEYVNMALQYLKMDEGNDLIIKSCDLDEIVRQAVHKYAPMFIRKKLTLTYEPLNCKVLTDERWLVFVVEQLLSNAIKYTNKGGVTIYLLNQPETTLVIQDTGIGIAWEDQPRIFEKGYTGLNGHSNKSSTGIGLYLCQRILRRLSHKISVESEPGHGTKFYIGLETAPLYHLTKV